jgi:hypothetical protein
VRIKDGSQTFLQQLAFCGQESGKKAAPAIVTEAAPVSPETMLRQFLGSLPDSTLETLRTEVGSVYEAGQTEIRLILSMDIRSWGDIITNVSALLQQVQTQRALQTERPCLRVEVKDFIKKRIVLIFSESQYVRALYEALDDVCVEKGLRSEPLGGPELGEACSSPEALFDSEPWAQENILDWLSTLVRGNVITTDSLMDAAKRRPGQRLSQPLFEQICMQPERVVLQALGEMANGRLLEALVEMGLLNLSDGYGYKLTVNVTSKLRAAVEAARARGDNVVGETSDARFLEELSERGITLEMDDGWWPLGFQRTVLEVISERLEEGEEILFEGPEEFIDLLDEKGVHLETDQRRTVLDTPFYAIGDVLGIGPYLEDNMEAAFRSVGIELNQLSKRDFMRVVDPDLLKKVVNHMKGRVEEYDYQDAMSGNY